MTARESYSFVESAKLLGVSRWTIGRLVHAGKLAAFHVGGASRIHLSELRRYKREKAFEITRPGAGADGSRR